MNNAIVREGAKLLWSVIRSLLRQGLMKKLGGLLQSRSPAVRMPRSTPAPGREPRSRSPGQPDPVSGSENAVDTDQWRRLLADSFEDARMSRAERQSLQAFIDDEPPAGGQLHQLRAEAFAVVRTADADESAKLAWLEDTVKVLLNAAGADERADRPTEAVFSEESDAAAKLAGLFRTARRHVDVCVFTITDDRVSDAILEAHRRGVAVRIVTDDDKAGDRGSDVDRLRRGGIPVRTDRSEYHMHHKFAVFDRKTLVTGSYNWTRGASRYNAENFVVTGERALVDDFLRHFDQMWRRWG